MADFHEFTVDVTNACSGVMMVPLCVSSVMVLKIED
jgi:hypothetical protein